MSKFTTGLLSGLFIFLVFLGACGITLPSGNIVVNQRPEANAGADQNANLGERVSLNGLSSTDMDGDRLTFIWSQTSGPSVSLDDPNNATPGFVPSQDGIYEFTLTVSDGRSSDQDTMRAFVGSVAPSGCPRADAGVDQTVREGQAVTLRGGNTADPDGDPLEYEWSQLEGPDVSLTNVFAVEPGFTAPVTDSDVDIVFELLVRDPDGCTDTDTVTITVQDSEDENNNANDNVIANDNGNANGNDNANDNDIPNGNDNANDDENDNSAVCSTADCDDGLFCNGEETCVDGECSAGASPCPDDETCNEEADYCAAAGPAHIKPLLQQGLP